MKKVISIFFVVVAGGILAFSLSRKSPPEQDLAIPVSVPMEESSVVLKKKPVAPPPAVRLPSRISIPESRTITELDWERIPESFKPLFGSDKSGYKKRYRFVDVLGSDLPEQELKALLMFIAADPETVGLTRGSFNGLGDKVLEKLEQQDAVPPELIDSLVAMFYDESGDSNWRDYCLQHLGALYRTDAANGKRPLIRQLYTDAMKPESGMAGTAVLALGNSMDGTTLTQAKVSEQAAEVALDDQQPDPTRLSAMLKGAELGNRDMLILARDIIDSSHSAHFRMSALAVVGVLGDVSDLPLLEKYTESSDMRFRNASRAAVKKINIRQNQSVVKLKPNIN